MFLRVTILIYQQNIDSVCFDVEFLCYVNILSYYCVCVLAHLGKKNLYILLSKSIDTLCFLPGNDDDSQ